MFSMFLSVGIGGAIGAILRFAIGLFVNERFGAAGWLATLSVNIAGCALMGMLAAYIAQSGQIPESARAFLAVGFLGSLTTFSSFTLDGYGFWLRGDIIGASLYVGTTVFFSLMAFAAGYLFLKIVLVG